MIKMPKPTVAKNIQRAGLGLRSEFLDEVLQKGLPQAIDFLEIAPENWVNIGGARADKLRALTAKYPFVCHGLSLNLGGFAPLDVAYLQQLKIFFRENNIQIYSEHLSYCADDGHLYDLLPIPFTEEAVKHTAGRIRQVQDILERTIAIENVSSYIMPEIKDQKSLTEIEFVNAVLAESNCHLLLDINNIYVNSVNHGFDTKNYLNQIDKNKIAYAHIAGHYNETPDLKIDTHGSAVCNEVWDLLDQAYALFGVFPTLLERDFNIPPMPELLKEINIIRQKQKVLN